MRGLIMNINKAFLTIIENKGINGYPFGMREFGKYYFYMADERIKGIDKVQIGDPFSFIENDSLDGMLADKLRFYKDAPYTFESVTLGSGREGEFKGFISVKDDVYAWTSDGVAVSDQKNYYRWIWNKQGLIDRNIIKMVYDETRDAFYLITQKDVYVSTDKCQTFISMKFNYYSSNQYELTSIGCRTIKTIVDDVETQATEIVVGTNGHGIYYTRVPLNVLITDPISWVAATKKQLLNNPPTMYDGYLKKLSIKSIVKMPNRLCPLSDHIVDMKWVPEWNNWLFASNNGLFRTPDLITFSGITNENKPNFDPYPILEYDLKSVKDRFINLTYYYGTYITALELSSYYTSSINVIRPNYICPIKSTFKPNGYTPTNVQVIHNGVTKPATLVSGEYSYIFNAKEGETHTVQFSFTVLGKNYVTDIDTIPAVVFPTSTEVLAFYISHSYNAAPDTVTFTSYPLMTVIPPEWKKTQRLMYVNGMYLSTIKDDTTPSPPINKEDPAVYNGLYKSTSMDAVIRMEISDTEDIKDVIDICYGFNIYVFLMSNNEMLYSFDNMNTFLRRKPSHGYDGRKALSIFKLNDRFIFGSKTGIIVSIEDRIRLSFLDVNRNKDENKTLAEVMPDSNLFEFTIALFNSGRMNNPIIKRTFTFQNRKAEYVFVLMTAKLPNGRYYRNWYLFGKEDRYNEMQQVAAEFGVGL